MALTLNEIGQKKTPNKKDSLDSKTTKPTQKMSASKGKVIDSLTESTPTRKKVVAPKKPTAKIDSVKKVRPWQTAEEMEHIEGQQTKKVASQKKASTKQFFPELITMELAGRPLPSEIVEVLHKVEGFKNNCLAQLPPEVNAFVKNTWLTKLQVYPKIKIPMPGFLVQKEKNE